MHGYHVERATAEHAALVIKDLRAEDLREWIEAARRLRVMDKEVSEGWLVETLAASIKLSEKARALVSDDGKTVLCIWGVGPHPKHSASGVTWLVGTNEGQRQAHKVQRLFREGVEELHGLYGLLEAHVYAVNHVHVFWLAKMGFEDQGPSDLIPGEVFRCMVRRAS